MPYYSAADYANYGPANSASFAPPVPPPPNINPASPAGGGAAAPITGNLNPLGGGALQQAMNAPTSGSIGQMIAAPNSSTGGGSPQGQSWYSNPAFWQGAGSVGSAYLKFLTDQKQPEFAKPFGSTVTPQTLNPLAGARSSPIQPPQLVV